MLPSCDIDMDPSGMPITTRDSLNNEFFTRALTAFPDRITDGEFTSAMKARLSIETSRRRIDPWKEQFFEQYWGQLSEKKPVAEARRSVQLAKLSKLDAVIAKLSPQNVSRSSPNARKPANGNPPAAVKSEPVKTENVKPEPDDPEDDDDSGKFPAINHIQETVIQSWEAIQAVKTLTSPEMQVMFRTHFFEHFFDSFEHFFRTLFKLK